jgi:hypothetical protein
MDIDEIDYVVIEGEYYGNRDQSHRKGHSIQTAFQ